MGSNWSTASAFLTYGHIGLVESVKEVNNGLYIVVNGANQGGSDEACGCNNVNSIGFTMPTTKRGSVIIMRKNNYSYKCFSSNQNGFIPQLISPISNAENLENPVQFTWQDVGNNPEYKIQIATSKADFNELEGFNNSYLVKSINTGSAENFTWSGGQPNKTYYWTVRSFANGIVSHFATPRKLSVKNQNTDTVDLRYYKLQILDGINGQGNGNGNGIVEAGESIDLRILLKNYGNANATNVSATLNTNDNAISMIDTNENFGTINSNQSQWTYGDFDFTVDSNCPNKTVSFNLNIQSNQGNFTDSFAINIQANTSTPDIHYYESQILDGIDGQGIGNSNGIVEAGERIDLRVKLKNYGNGDATNVLATLSTNDSYVSITDSSERFGTINASSSVWTYGDFDFTIDNNCPNKSVTFYLNIQSDQGNFTDSFTINVQASQNDNSNSVSFSPSIGSYTSCNIGNSYGAGCSGTYEGDVLKFRATYFEESSHRVGFQLKKCSGSFTGQGTVYLKKGGFCGEIIAQQDYSAGVSSIYFDNIDVPVSGNHQYTIVIVTNHNLKYYTDSIYMNH